MIRIKPQELRIKGFKKILGFVVLGISFGVLLTSCANISYALTNTNSTSSAALPNRQLTPRGLSSTASAARQENQMMALKTRADKEIERRVASLNKAISRVNSLKKLSSEQKSSFDSQLQAQIDSLNALKVKIDADTDMVTLKADVKSVVTSYRIYALYIPQISILVASDGILTTVDMFNSYILKLQAKIDAAKASGSDVTALQATLTDMQNKVKDATTQANSASASALPLTPAGYPGNISTLKTARANLKTARTDLQTARQDGLSINQGLKALNPSTPSATTTISVSTGSGTEISR